MPTRKYVYELFRVKFIKDGQQKLFVEDLTPAELFSKALAEEPKYETRKGSTWRIGNIKRLNDESGYFLIGRRSKSTFSDYVEEESKFVDFEMSNYPNTRVLYDTSIGLIAIAHNTELAPTTTSIADKLIRLFEATETVTTHEISVEIGMIPDPVNFFSKIRNADAVLEFSATFTGPNPIDADEIFQRPLSHLTQEINGENGRISIEGSNLNKDVVEGIARSTAATGNNGSAKIRPAPGKRATTVPIGRAPAQITYSENEHSEQYALLGMKNAYTRIRHEGTEDK